MTLAVVAWALIAATALGVLVDRRRRRPPAPASAPVPEWKVKVTAASRAEADYYREHSERNIYPVVGEVSVRVILGAKTLSIGTVRMDDDAFEGKLNGLVAQAEDRAAALNAVEAETA